MLDTVRMPRAVPTKPKRIAFNAVWVSILVAIRASRKRRAYTVVYGAIRVKLRADRI
jgi:hypothetical protein